MLLKVEGLSAGYGGSRVLQGVGFSLREGECVCLLGRNGSGRSTLLHALIGRLPVTGSIVWRGRDASGWPTSERVRAGFGLVPEGREVFTQLTVEQNLRLGEWRSSWMRRWRPSSGWSLEDVWRRFPRLAERRHLPAGLLSGGEQQVLALCRTALGRPALYLVDEPTEGLSPQWIDEVRLFLREVQSAGAAVVLVEQKLMLALDLAERALVMGRGEIVYDGPSAPLRGDEHPVRREWIEV